MLSKLQGKDVLTFGNIKWGAGPDDDLIGVIQSPGIFEVQGLAMQMTEATQDPSD